MTPPIVANITEDDSKTVERYRAYLKLLACTQVDSWLGQRVDASDLVQQTLLDAVARCDQFRGDSESEFLAWLRRILSNNLVDACRYHGREKRDIARNRSLEEEISTSFRRIDALAGDDIELVNMTLAARFIATAALLRRESRGGHYRSDFSESDPGQARRSHLTLAQLNAATP